MISRNKYFETDSIKDVGVRLRSKETVVHSTSDSITGMDLHHFIPRLATTSRKMLDGAGNVRRAAVVHLDSFRGIQGEPAGDSFGKHIEGVGIEMTVMIVHVKESHGEWGLSPASS